MTDEKTDTPDEEATELSIEDQIQATITAMENDDAEEEQPAEEAATPQEGEEDQDEEAASEDDDEPEGESGEVKLDAPDQWSDEDKALLASIPEEHRELILNTRKSLESGYQDKFTALANDRKGFVTQQTEYDQIVNLTAPFEAQLQAQGLDRVGGIRALVGAQQMLIQNPVVGLTQLIQQYGGANASAIIQTIAQSMGVTTQGPDTEAEEYVDPQVQNLTQRLNQFETNALNQQQFTQQQNLAAAQAERDVFAGTTNEDGSLKFPHFEKLEQPILSLLANKMAGSWEEAYEGAVMQNPDTRAEWLETRDQARTAKDDTARKASVKKAKKASRDVSKSGAAPTTPVAIPDTIEESVRRAVEASAG